MIRSTEILKLDEISRERSITSQDGAKLCAEDLLKSVNVRHRLKRKHQPCLLCIPGCTFFFFHLFAII